MNAAPAPLFPGVRACVFDAYGTLFDVASAAARCDAVPVEKRAALAALWRDKQLQYTWLRTLQARYVDFETVTGDALDFALETLGLADPARRARLMDLYRALDAHADAKPALSALRAAGQKIAILSNGSPAMLDAALAASGLGPLIDDAISVDSARVFKTHPDAYRLALGRLAFPARDILFVSSNGWDAYAASDFGMKVAWCNRSGQPPERLPGEPDAVVSSLTELPGLVGTR